MKNALTVICATLMRALEWYLFCEYAGYVLIDQVKFMAKYLYCTKIMLLNTTHKALSDTETPVAISVVTEYNLYAFRLWGSHISMRNMYIDPANF